VADRSARYLSTHAAERDAEHVGGPGPLSPSGSGVKRVMTWRF